MEKELRILMVEDIEEDAGLVDRVLNKEKIAFTRLRVDTRDEFSDALINFHPDIIICDHSLPQFNSIEALKLIQEKSIDIPFILVTGSVSEEFAVSCLKQGIDDYILKSNLSRLPMAIKTSIRQHHFEKMRRDHEEMLEVQNAELLKVNKELDSFVYSISHSLRSPVSSALGLVNVARFRPKNNELSADEYFQLIEKSILKLDNTLKQIQQYSQNLRAELIHTKINIPQLIEKSWNQIKDLNGFENIHKEIILEENSLFYSDEFRLSTILTHLLTNAVRYADGKKIKTNIIIKIAVNPSSAVIKIIDNGIGIEPEYLPKVYKMFYRAAEISDGAGLGLYLVKEMVDKLNGTIDIQSKPLEGTTALLTLPNHMS